MTPDGEVRDRRDCSPGLPDAQGVLCGSILSGLRMQPGIWSGAYVCWGTENREAAVRFLIGGPSNPHGANVEVKVIDPSANPYFATAAILGLALDGIERKLPLPPETTVDPASAHRRATQSGRHQAAARRARPTRSMRSTQSALLRGILGDEAGRRDRRGAALRAGELRRSEPRRARREVPAGLERVSEVVSPALAEHIENVPLVDHHVHGCWLAAPRPRPVRERSQRGQHRTARATSTRRSTPSSVSRSARIAHRCSGLPRHADADAYWNRRSEHAECDAGRAVPVAMPRCPTGWWTPDSPVASPISTRWPDCRSGVPTRSSDWSRLPKRPSRHPATTRRRSAASWTGGRRPR